MRVCACTVGSVCCVCDGGVCAGGKDGNAVVSYTGKELPGSARGTPAPWTPRWPCAFIHHLKSCMPLILPSLLGSQIKLLVQFSKYLWECYTGPRTRKARCRHNPPDLQEPQSSREQAQKAAILAPGNPRRAISSVLARGSTKPSGRGQRRQFWNPGAEVLESHCLDLNLCSS